MSDESFEQSDSGPVLTAGSAQSLEASSEDHLKHPRNPRESAIMIAASQILKHHSGPLPDPETLEAYERILPGTAERILLQFEKQSDHRMALENKAVQSDAFTQTWSTISGSVLALCAVAGGILLAWTGHYASGLSMFFGTLFTFLGTFVAGKKAQAAAFDEKAKKRQLLQNPSQSSTTDNATGTAK